MDNVTHSVAGLVLAESATQLRARYTGREPSARFRSTAAVSSMIAANLPDADLFYRTAGSGPLTYMLYHRGYTHTLVGAILAAALVWGGAMVVRRLGVTATPARGDAAWLLALILASTLSHLVLDWTNSYGVHPFWPWDDGWRYGDSVFIVEPWFWVWTIPLLVASSTDRRAKVTLCLVLLIGLTLAWRVDLVLRGAAAALTAGAGLSAILARRLSPSARPAAAVIGWVAITVGMAAGSGVARETAIRSVLAADPAAQLLDVVVTPLPATPLCATVITVERSGDIYRAATARVSAAPTLVEASYCRTRGGTGGVLRRSARQSTPAVHWDAEWTVRLADLRSLARESCPARAALRFIRVPIWRTVSDSTVILGDLRYGDTSGSGFSDVSVPRRSPVCPEAVPPWTPPRADLLGPSALGNP